MRQLLIKAEYLQESTTYIGKVGENNATQVKIDTTFWINKFQDIDFEAIYKRADGVLYPIDIKQDGNYITWNVTRKDLYKSGTSYLTIIGYKNSQKVLSTKAICLIMPGLNGITIDSDYEGDPTPTKWIQGVVDEIKENAGITQVTVGNGLNANIIDKNLTLGITSISTDLLINGEKTLIINCGTANKFDKQN